MGADDRLKTKPSLPPKPQIKWGAPQKSLDSSSSNTTTTMNAQYMTTHEPLRFKPDYTLNQADNADRASLYNTDTSDSNESSKTHPLPPSCPSYCACVCHNGSQNESKKTHDVEDHYIITLQNNDDKVCRKLSANVSVPARPLPKEPWKMIIQNDCATDDVIYGKVELPKPDDDIAPNSSKTEPIADGLKIPSQKTIPTPRKRCKKKMTVQDQSTCLQNFQEMLINELRQMLSPDANEKQKTMKNKFFNAMISEENSATWPEQSSNILHKSLWQERCDVQKSGILNRITKKELLLQESIYEVATSEQSYFEQLNVIVNHFMKSPKLNSMIAPQVQKSLFSSIQEMREISKNFLNSMVQKLGSGLFCGDLCDVVHDYANGPFTAYVDYIRNIPCQKHTLIKLRKEIPCFVDILNKLQENPCCNRLPLDSFLPLPFQRLVHLKVLMETILKRTDSNTEVQAAADAAFKKISEVLDFCNTEVGKVKQIEELLNIANKIEFVCKALPLVSASRWLITDGELTKLCLYEKKIVQRKKCSVYLILFNDLLLVASKKVSDRYMVHDHVHRSLIEVTEGDKVEDDLEGYDVRRVFLLAILKNHRGVSEQLLLMASTIEERDRWLQVLKREEGVYEEWDCPQVRCIEGYIEQKPGELSLQPEDIVSIIQKTSDGLIEGQRLSDGKRGWFPAKCVMEINNEHVQRRNLRQRHRVLQTAASILKTRNISQDQQSTSCFNLLC